MVRLNTNLIALIALVFLLNGGLFSQNDIKKINAKRTNTPIIDGIYNNDEWEIGEVASGFIQREPNEGVKATQNTEVRFLYDEKYLYVGIKCFDDNPELISEAFSNRDKYGSGDYVGIMLDTFHDHINSYLFAVTAVGTQIDGKCFNDSRKSFDWDGIWWSETSVTSYGWIAEIKIPFTTLQFDEQQDEWGVNIFRNVARERELSYWQFQNRDYQFRVSKNGHLGNLTNLKNGTNLNFIPYITTSFNEDRISSFKMRNNNGISGFDLKYGVSSNLNLVVTVNPDFAQIEADDDRINLSHYPLYLSEKRPFFLEGNEIFRTQGSSYNSNMFYSRRINAPLYGAKMTGKIGEWNIGFLHSLNDDDGGIQNLIDNEELNSEFDKSAYYNVLRINRDIFDNSQIGLIAMSKEYSGKYNRMFGLDAQFRFLDKYRVSVEVGKSIVDQKQNNDNHSIMIGLNRNSDFFSFNMNYSEQGSDFLGNQIGFYNYNNFRKVSGGLRFGPRFEEIGIRWMGLGLDATTLNYHSKNFFDKSTLTREVEFWTMISSNNYWAIRASVSGGKRFDRVHEYLYDALRYSIFLDNNRNSDIYFNVSHNQGKYRGGYNWRYKASVTLKPTDKLTTQFSYDRSLVKYYNILEEEFIEQFHEIVISKFYYYFTDKLNVRLIAQYSVFDERFSSYFLLGYRFSPGCSLFLAYNEQYDSDVYEVNDIEYYPEFSSSQKVLQLKFSYLIQF